jgi:hypothetical protein
MRIFRTITISAIHTSFWAMAGERLLSMLIESDRVLIVNQKTG